MSRYVSAFGRAGLTATMEALNHSQTTPWVPKHSTGWLIPLAPPTSEVYQYRIATSFIRTLRWLVIVIQMLGASWVVEPIAYSHNWTVNDGMLGSPVPPVPAPAAPAAPPAPPAPPGAPPA